MFDIYGKLKIWNLVFLSSTFFSSCIGGKTNLNPVLRKIYLHLFT